MLKLYYVTGACSFAPHIVLHESGLSFQIDKVNPADKQTESGLDYNTINAKGSVPSLHMNNGQLLTECAVIVQYIADLVPEKKLAPLNGTIERYRLQELLNYIATDIHKGFSPLFNPKLSDEAKSVLKERLLMRIAYVAQILEGKDYLVGKTFTVADAYLFTVLRWSPRMGVDLSQWTAIQSYMDRIATRPAVIAAMRAEGMVVN